MASQHQATSPEESQYHNFTKPSLRIDDHTLDENLCPQKLPELALARPECKLGPLDKLPLELLHIIVPELDICSLEHLRLTNRRAQQVVSSHIQYRAIKAHASDAIRAILAIEAGQRITLQMLYDTLCTAECVTCGDFGGYVYLITCKRVCYFCFTGHPNYLPLRYKRAIEMFGLDRKILLGLPQIRSIPGVWTHLGKRERGRIWLVDPVSASSAGIKQHGGRAAMEDYVAQRWAVKMQEYEDRAPARQHRHRPNPDGPWDGKSNNPLRFMAVIRLPWLNKALQDVEFGRYCKGCRNNYGESHPLKDFRRKYSAASFAKHIQLCGRVEGEKHVSTG